jgi:AcrR family transcriptional regulator
MPKASPLQAQRAPHHADGRRRRSNDSRHRIVEAMLELAREGDVAPSAELVAERAGVGRRTVFRLFKDMESLYREMHAAMLARIEHIRAIPIEGATWRKRLDCLIERRVQLYEEIMPIKTAADSQRLQSQFLQEAHADLVRTLRQMLQFVLPKVVKDDAEAFEALDATLSLDVWRRLRLDQNLSVKAARRVLERMVAAIIA